jgi:hypothetical protein
MLFARNEMRNEFDCLQPVVRESRPDQKSAARVRSWFYCDPLTWPKYRQSRKAALLAIRKQHHYLGLTIARRRPRSVRATIANEPVALP